MSNLNVYVDGLQYQLIDEAAAQVYEKALQMRKDGAISDTIFDQYRKSLLISYPRQPKKAYQGRKRRAA